MRDRTGRRVTPLDNLERSEFYSTNPRRAPLWSTLAVVFHVYDFYVEVFDSIFHIYNE